MSSITALQDKFADFAKDIRNNLGNVLTPEGAPGLTQKQIFGVALASAYVQARPEVVQALVAEGQAELGESGITAAKAAATLMAMNNVYYRAIHYSEDAELGKLPARLRMTVMANPGVDKVDFELYALAVSAINGCKGCVQAHVNEAKKKGISIEGVQSTLRIASVVHAAAQALRL